MNKKQILNRMLQLRSQQCGATLAIVLIFLVLVTLIGVTAISTTTLEEKMAGNVKEKNRAFQAAEAALRDAKLDITGTGIDGMPSATRRIPPISGETDFGSSPTARPSCSATVGPTLGLCLTTSDKFTHIIVDEISGAIIDHNSTFTLTQNFTEAPSVRYGTYTGAPVLADVVTQPRYLIEAVKVCESGGKCPSFMYRITARGYGARMESQATIQEVFRLE